MGTYCSIKLKNLTEKNINEINFELMKRGYRTKHFNNVMYGAFRNRAMTKEDLRFMNEEEEGIKQMPHWERPITLKQLKTLHWFDLGTYEIKLSGGSSEDELQYTLILGEWAVENENKIDKENSYNYSPEFIKEYMR